MKTAREHPQVNGLSKTCADLTDVPRDECWWIRLLRLLGLSGVNTSRWMKKIQRKYHCTIITSVYIYIYILICCVCTCTCMSTKKKYYYYCIVLSVHNCICIHMYMHNFVCIVYPMQFLSTTLVLLGKIFIPQIEDRAKISVMQG